jgi:acyl-CoA reductase-like NAD-dependent aldehyde dehydrogenase
MVLERQDDLMDLMQLETGKARRDAFEEVGDVANNARYYAFRAGSHLMRQRRPGAIPLLTHTERWLHPYGIVAVITPWNYPFTLVASESLPALLAGNAVILKPSERTPLTALRAAHLFLEAGFPDGLFQVLTGWGEEIGPALIGRVDYVAFTGSTRVGREIARMAAERLIPASLELGGKNPMLVLNDAPLKRCVEGAVQGCFSNAGQLCVSFERLYVQRGIYQAFVEDFVARTRELTLGAAFDFSADIGSLVSRDQLDKTVRHVEDALSKGARVLAGGRPRPDIGPYFFEPTILTDVAPGMLLFDEETFGPVVSIYGFEDVEKAVTTANASTYGLNASIWTNSTSRGRRIASRIECGSVSVIDTYAATWGSVGSPIGGMKSSGIGRRHGPEGLLRYTESQTIAVQRVLGVGARFGDKADLYRRLATAGLRVLRRLGRR